MTRGTLLPGEFFEVLTAAALNGTATIYSNSVDTRQMRYLAVRIQANSSGTPNIKVEWESSNARPSTEQAADTKYVVPDNMTTPWTSIADALWHVTQIFPAPSSYGRLKITGNSGNPSDTTVTAQVFMQG